MIGIVIVTHSQLGDALIGAAEFIIGSRPESIESVSIDLSENAEKLRGKIDRGIKKVMGEKGVIILTDMFGGTPSNISLSFLKEGEVEVLTGVNLPMVLAIARNRSDLTLSEVAKTAEEAGKMSISLASKLLMDSG